MNDLDTTEQSNIGEWEAVNLIDTSNCSGLKRVLLEVVNDFAQALIDSARAQQELNPYGRPWTDYY